MRIVVGALISAIAIYFALFWGFDALRVLTSPTYGLEDVWRSQVVFGIGRFIGLDPTGLLKLAAVLGALKLTVAAVCIIHVIERLRSFVSGTTHNEILETGLLIAVAISIASAAPAIWSQNGDLMRSILLQLMLAGFAAVLCIIERRSRKPEAKADEVTAIEAAIAAGAAPVDASKPFVPWRR